MAVVALGVEQVTRAGLAATYTGSLSTADTYTFPNDGKVYVHVKKSGAAECVVTITAPGTFYGLGVEDLEVTVPATTGDRFIGPFPPPVFNDASGLTTMSFSNIAGVTVAVLHMA